MLVARHRVGNAARTVVGTGLEDRIRRTAVGANLSRRFRALRQQRRMIPAVVVGDGLGIPDRGLLMVIAGRLCLTIAVAEAERNRLPQGNRLQRLIEVVCRKAMEIPRGIAAVEGVMIRVLHGSGQLIQHQGE